MSGLTTRALVLSIAGAVLVGMELGYILRGSPAPSPTVRAADSAAAVHTPGLARIDTIYQRDTVHSNHWFTQWDTLRKVDTIVHDSIVYVRRDVADSTVHACRLSLFDCGRRGDSLATALTLAHSQIAARDAEKPSRLHAILTDAGWAATGYAACRANVGAHLPIPFLH